MPDVTTTVRALAAPLAQQAGLDLVNVVVKRAGARMLVRLAVDRKGGVDVSACQQMSRLLSEALDQADPLADSYTLEVSSPGLDHPLTDQRDFDRIEGREVLVHRQGTTQEVRGRVCAAEPAAVVLDVNGDELRIAYDQIIRATQALPW